MWCIAELDDEYIEKMEDVLETYERPYDPDEPVVCVDEKPVTLHARYPAALSGSAGTGGQARFRLRTLRHGECLLRGGT